MKLRYQVLSSIGGLFSRRLGTKEEGEEEEAFERVPKRCCSPYYTFQPFFHVQFIEGCEFRDNDGSLIGRLGEKTSWIRNFRKHRCDKHDNIRPMPSNSHSNSDEIRSIDSSPNDRRQHLTSIEKLNSDFWRGIRDEWSPILENLLSPLRRVISINSLCYKACWSREWEDPALKLHATEDNWIICTRPTNSSIKIDRRKIKISLLKLRTNKYLHYRWNNSKIHRVRFNFE